MFTDRK